MPSKKPRSPASGILYVRLTGTEKTELDRLARNAKKPTTSDYVRAVIKYLTENPLESLELIKEAGQDDGPVGPIRRLRSAVATHQEAEHAFVTRDYIRAVEAYETLLRNLLGDGDHTSTQRLDAESAHLMLIHYRLAYIWTALAYSRFDQMLDQLAGQPGDLDTRDLDSWVKDLPLVVGSLRRAQAVARPCLDRRSGSMATDVRSHVGLAARFNAACGLAMHAQILLEDFIVRSEHPVISNILGGYLADIRAQPGSRQLRRCDLAVRALNLGLPRELEEEVEQLTLSSLDKLNETLVLFTENSEKDANNGLRTSGDLARDWLRWSIDTDDDLALLARHPKTAALFAHRCRSLDGHGLDAWMRAKLRDDQE